MNLEKIDEIIERLTRASAPLRAAKTAKIFSAVESVLDAVEAAWSGSWLGYHARVYHEGLVEPPPGAQFSKEWGLGNHMGLGTSGAWREFPRQEVTDEIWRRAGSPTLGPLRSDAENAIAAFEESKAEIQSILSPARRKYSEDKFLIDIITKIDGMKIVAEREYFAYLSPKGQQMSRDANAINAGFHVPPHYSVKAEVAMLKQPLIACNDLATQAKRVASHLATLEKDGIKMNRIGTKIFIGHGRSKVWKELKDFIQDRLRLPWDEFNRVPVAGFTNIARLSEMLDHAAFAFLVMTAEDEQNDGKLHARMNVVHEAGLFQGRLGFQRAIILLEEGCEEFSNVQGLGQIRFPKGDVTKAFEEIRMVLEREELLFE